MQLDDIALSYYQHNNAGALWQGIPVQETTNTPTWQWSQYERNIVPGDLDTINQLIQADWQRLDIGSWQKQADGGKTYFHLCGQLAIVQLMEMPGNSGDYQMWAQRADVERIKAMPVSLSFARIDLSDIDATGAIRYVGDSGLTVLHVEQMLPPPQFGELALVDDMVSGVAVWKIYKLSALGEAGFDVWLRMGKALKELAAPAEWWPHTPRLAACLNGQYTQIREHMRSQLLATRGEARETWRKELAALEIDHKHAQALQSARQRARKNPRAWLDQWQEMRAMAVELASLYWHAHITQADHNAVSIAIDEPDEIGETETLDEADATIDSGEQYEQSDSTAQPRSPEDPESVAMLAQLTGAGVVDSAAPTLDTPSYQEDRAAREALLSDKTAWPTESGMYRYRASNNYAVYFGDPNHPVKLEEAQAQLLRIREGTLLTVRIAEGVWNLRRRDAKYARNGMVAITYDEILQWRGVKKHSRQAHPGTNSTQRVSDGYRTEDRDDVRGDFAIARQLYLLGSHPVFRHGKETVVNTDASYIRAAFISTPTLWGDEQLGLWFAPGDWITAYEEADNVYLAEIDRRVFQLNPQNEQHELKLALFLAEQWRYQARGARYNEPMTMANLLEQSVISVDRPNLTSRFAPRIEQALENLRKRGIIGSHEYLDPVDKTKGRWGKAWLAARWRILPPDSLAQSYLAKGVTQAQLPDGRKGKAATRK